MGSSRKLLEGVRVEVRQKEVGLRGSWHPGVVVEVKAGRRVVEYDDLLTLDGRKKLREIIPLSENSHVKLSAPIDQTNRGFIRPLPPPCYLSCVTSPKRGLLVDAFYNDAWWEGILLHDALSRVGHSKVKIFFPEEGDELLCFMKDVRVSQEWDEWSGQWVSGGSWSFCGDNREIDIDFLRSICRQRNSSLKKVWRQRCSLTSLTLKNVGGDKKTAVDKFHSSGGGTALPLDKQGDQEVSSTSNNVQVDCLAVSKVQRGDTAKSLVIQRGELNHGADKWKPSASNKFLMKQSQCAAKRFLMDVGWKIKVRVRRQGITQGMKEAVYVSPDGSKYYSLASACRGWKKFNNLPSILEEGISQRLKLLDAYNLPKQLTPFHKRLFTSRQQQDTCEQNVWEGNLQAYHSSLARAKNRRPAKGSCRKAEDIKLMMFSSSMQKNKPRVVTEKLKKRKSFEDRTDQKSKPTFCIEKLKKRKCIEEASEQKCRKGKSSSKHEVSLLDSKASGSRGGCRMQVLLSSPGWQSNSKLAQTRTEATHFKKSTVLSWLIEKGIIKDKETVRYLSKKDGHVMKRGKVTREGVLCKCCEVVFTLSNFEAHAGSKLHRPSANIFLDDGRSITDCQLQACALQDAKEDSQADVSDDTCGVCADGGELILCDHCPSTFHPNCIGLEEVPDGDWYCPRCLCGQCGEIKVGGNEANTLHRCDQCELGYHPVCVPESVLLKPIGGRKGAWFCGHQCQQIFTDLRRLVGKINNLGDDYFWMLLRSMKGDVGLPPSSIEMMAEHNVKLGVAHDVMQECFIPMIDPRTKINLISQALYNRKCKVLRLDYSGFYTIILEKGDEMISVATIRVHGGRLAEMPLVGTRYQYRRQGMCRRLMQALEQMLESIGVNKLVLPAVPELLETWTGAFNFQHITATETQELSRLNLMTFPGTILLQKKLRNKPSTMILSQKVDTCEKDSLFVGGIPFHTGVADSGQSDCYGLKELPSLSQTVLHHDITPLSFQGRLSTTHVTNKGHWSYDSDSLINTSSGGIAEKGDELQYARVVRATTRSKRLVKSSKWIADGLRELAKDIEESSCSLGTTGNMRTDLTDKLNLSIGILSQLDRMRETSRMNSLSNLPTHSTMLNPDDPLVATWPRSTFGRSINDCLSIFLSEAIFVFSPNHYVRRKRTKEQGGEMTWNASHIPVQ